MLLNTIDTSSMHSISSLLDTITYRTPGAQPGETTRQRNADNGSLERERQREGESHRVRPCDEHMDEHDPSKNLFEAIHLTCLSA